MKRFHLFRIYLGLLFVALGFGQLLSEEVPGNRFFMTQLLLVQEPRLWDPYPTSPRSILSYLERVTSIRVSSAKRAAFLDSHDLFGSPFLLWSGLEGFDLTDAEKTNLKRYLAGGGFILVEDRSGERNGSFDASLRKILRELFPDKELEIVSKEHAIYKSFFLLRSVSGRLATNPYLEGLEIDGRTALVYSQNDILGAWAKDPLGNPLLPCEPGGEAQRTEAVKVTINLVLYSVTGNYKTDPIHLPFIQRKLGNE